MPKTWYIMSENRIDYDNDSQEEIEHKKFYQSICATKKPYFFAFNYLSLKKEYDDYIANVDNKACSMFGVHYKELRNKAVKTSQEEQFVSWAEKKNPLDMSPSVVNKICWAIEDEFDNIDFSKRDKFDYSMIKSGSNYLSSKYYSIESLYKWYKIAKADGKIDKEEVEQAVEIVTEHVDKINNEIKKGGK